MWTGDKSIHPVFDVKLTPQQNGSLSTCTYRKPTHTDEYLHFASYHPRAHKSSVVTTLMRRAFTHCSTEKERKGELARVHNALTKLTGYPRWFIDSRLPESKRWAETRKNNPDSYACIPYVQGVLKAISDKNTGRNRHPHLLQTSKHHKQARFHTLKTDWVPLLNKSG